MDVQPQLPTKNTQPPNYRGVYEPNNPKAFKISRSKIDTFMECRRCSYLDLRLGIKRPSGPPFTLNNAVDELFKREFDTHRASSTAHPLMKEYGIDAVPLAHENLEEWRDALRRGVTYHHPATNLLLTGGIDDVWQAPNGELIVVDYKATAKLKGPSTEDDLYNSYKRQIEVYQWLFKQNGFKVSSTGYFVYANGRADAKAFDGKLEFDVVLIPYTGSYAWVEPTLAELKAMLEDSTMPEVGKNFWGDDCDYCTYAKARTEVTLDALQKK